MTQQVIYTFSARIFILISGFSLFYVATLALISPQSIMDLVGIKLSNTDAVSSIRGVYGGVGVTLVLLLIYFGITNISHGITFLTIFWGSYGLSRMITWIVEGPLGEFGINWLIIESFLCITGLILILLKRKIISR